MHRVKSQEAVYIMRYEEQKTINNIQIKQNHLICSENGLVVEAFRQKKLSLHMIFLCKVKQPLENGLIVTLPWHAEGVLRRFLIPRYVAILEEKVFVDIHVVMNEIKGIETKRSGLDKGD